MSLCTDPSSPTPSTTSNSPSSPSSPTTNQQPSRKPFTFLTLTKHRSLCTELLIELILCVLRVIGIGRGQSDCLFSLQVMSEGLAGQKVKIDLIVIGNPNSGKTSLIRRFIDGETSFQHYYTPTLGLSLEKKLMKIEGADVTVCIWDTAGQEKFLSLTKNYFKKADGVLVVFDLTDKVSFERVDKFWIQQIKEKSDENCSQMLVGNKKDMAPDRAVSTEQARQLAEGLGMKYYETSAKTGEQVNECIEHLVRECLLKVKREIDSTNVDLRGAQQGSKGSCFSSLGDFLRGVKGKFKS